MITTLAPTPSVMRMTSSTAFFLPLSIQVTPGTLASAMRPRFSTGSHSITFEAPLIRASSAWMQPIMPLP